MRNVARNIINKLFLSILLITGIFSIAKAGPFIEIINIEPNKDYPLVKLQFSVKDININVINHLEEEHISVFEDGYKVARYKVKNFSEKEDYLYLVFSIDSSKSISKEFLHNIKAAAKELAGSTGPNDRIAVYTFNDQVFLLNNFSNKHGEILNSINKVQRTGKDTLLFNSIFDSIDLLTKEEDKKVQAREKKVIVFTDGKDEGSSVSSEDVIKFAREAGIPIYFICNEKSINKQRLSRIAKLSGGKMVISQNNHIDIARKYKMLLSGIKSRYEVLFDTFVKADGKKHQFEIRLKYNEIRDRDSINVQVKRTFFNLNFVNATRNVIIILVILGLIIILFCLVFIIKRIRQKSEIPVIAKKKFVDPVIQAKIDRLIKKEEKNEKKQDFVLKINDPEYVYASAWIVEREGPESGQKFPLYWDEATIGRGKDNTIIVTDESVSLNHAKIRNIDNIYHLFDCVSDNGTFLNGKKLLRPKKLHDWDEIGIGRTRFIFRGSGSIGIK